jgi:four helix bundle protein
MTNKTNNIKSKLQTTSTKYDLAERTAIFGEKIIDFTKSLPEDSVNKPLKSQIVRSGTSIGANYMEADAAESSLDFNHKIALCKKEAKETTYWFRIIAKSNPDKIDQCRIPLSRSKGINFNFFVNLT